MPGRLRVALLWLAFALLACKRDPPPAADDKGTKAPATPASSVVRSPAGPLELVVAYGSEKKTWFEESARAFEATGAAAPGGAVIKIMGKPMGSGQAVDAIASGSLKAHVFSPASRAYVGLLNEAWRARSGRTKEIAPAGELIVLSPLVIAMWKPMAEALGWPQKALGWSDLLTIAADPKGWGGKGFPEWGRFKLGHTHPEFSNSGLLAVLAEGYAGAKKTRGLTVADVEARPTRQLLEAVESTVVHYGKSTAFFSDKLLARGPSYLSAAVLYENLVIESYAQSPPPPQPLVAIYPREGTFWSDHPYSILETDGVTADHRAAAESFLAFLKARPQQERALALGFRPADNAIALGTPIDRAHGVDPKQPQALLDVPETATVDRLVALWKEVKKGADVVFVFDKSGSMRGKPLVEAKHGARTFFDNLADNDEATILFFDSKVYPPVGPFPLKTGRAELEKRIEGVTADGGTALYDAVATAHKLLLDRMAKSASRMHAIVVMTDGKDENSSLDLATVTRRFGSDDTQIRVFAIAYGEQTSTQALDTIAEAAKGTSVKGSVETINQVYGDMAAFF